MSQTLSNEFSKYNLNFVSGIEINLVEKEEFFTLLLYVQNEEGYRFILSLINSGKKVFNISIFGYGYKQCFQYSIFLWHKYLVFCTCISAS